MKIIEELKLKWKLQIEKLHWHGNACIAEEIAEEKYACPYISYRGTYHWEPLKIIEDHWRIVENHWRIIENQWFSMLFNGLQWFSMIFHDFQWFPMIFNGSNDRSPYRKYTDKHVFLRRFLPRCMRSCVNVAFEFSIVQFSQYKF